MSNLRPQNTLAPRGQAPVTFSAFITSNGIRKRINEMMGGKDGQRFVTAIVSAVTNNPELAKCDHMSIFSAAMLGESLGLSPSVQLGQFYMVPFKDKKRCLHPRQKNDKKFCNFQCEYNKQPGCKIATFQIGYKGYIQLAIRSGYYRKLNVLAIKEGELKSYDPLFEELDVELIQDEAKREAAPTIGYYAMFEYLNGFRKTMYWSKAKMEAHADRYSQAFKLDVCRRIQSGEIPASELWRREYSSFWYKDFDGMAYKTMLRQIISKWGIMSVELQKAFAEDHAKEVNAPDYIDAAPITPQDEQHREEPEKQPRQPEAAPGSPEEDFFSDAEDAPTQDTEESLAQVFGDNTRKYLDMNAAERKAHISKMLKAFGVQDADMDRKVGKSFGQWAKKERIVLLQAYFDLANGADPATVFPTA